MTIDWTKLSISAIFAVVVTCPQAAPEAGMWESLPLAAIQVKNRISKCLQLEPRKVVMNGAVVKLVAEGTFLQSTAECACTSALLSYTVFEQHNAEYRDQWVSAVVSTRSARAGHKRQFEFVLTSDATIRYRRSVMIEIDCAPHD